MAFQTIGTIGANLYQVDATPQFPLGLRVQAADPVYGVGEFQYMKTEQTNGAYTWMTYGMDNMVAARLVANAIDPVAIQMADMVSNQFGWYQIYGKAIGKALAGFLDNANVYATATGGSVDDAVVAGDRVKNAKGASAVGVPGSGLAEFEIAYPYMDDGLAA